MKKLLAVLLCLGFVGCETAPTLPSLNDRYQNQAENSVELLDLQTTSGEQTLLGPEPVTYHENVYLYKNYQVNIISDPPGAKIEWNNEYIEETPCVKVIDGRVGLPVNVTANPVFAGQYLQTKVLSENPIPRTIYFNMALGPVTPAVDVNVNQR